MLNVTKSEKIDLSCQEIKMLQLDGVAENIVTSESVTDM